MVNEYVKMLVVIVENGFKIKKYVSEQDIEGLKYGFLDLHEFADAKWYCEKNGTKKMKIESYYYEEADAEDLREINEFLKELEKNTLIDNKSRRYK